MFGLLRFIRGFIGFIFIISVADVLNPLIKKTNDPSVELSVTDSMWFEIFQTSSANQNITIGVVAAITTGFLFVLWRNIISSLHRKANLSSCCQNLVFVIHGVNYVK